MSKRNKEFFTNNEVLVVGYPLKADPTMRYLMQAFLKNRLKYSHLTAKP